MARALDNPVGLERPAGGEASGVDVFISHVEEDETVALELADGRLALHPLEDTGS